MQIFICLFSFYRQWNPEKGEHQRYFRNVIVLQGKIQLCVRKLNWKQQDCRFLACLHKLIFAVFDIQQ